MFSGETQRRMFLLTLALRAKGFSVNANSARVLNRIRFLRYARTPLTVTRRSGKLIFTGVIHRDGQTFANGIRRVLETSNAYATIEDKSVDHVCFDLSIYPSLSLSFFLSSSESLEYRLVGSQSSLRGTMGSINPR